MKALKHFLVHHCKPSDLVHVVHLVIHPTIPMGSSDEEKAKIMENFNKKEAELKTKVEQLAADKLISVKYAEQSCDAGDADAIGKKILEEVVDVKAEMIVIGCRGFTDHFLKILGHSISEF